MGILNFLSKKKKLKKSPEQIWDEYTFSYFKKYDLAMVLRDLLKGGDYDLSSPVLGHWKSIEKDLSVSKDLVPLSKKLASMTVVQAIIEIVGEIEKLIPEELVELSEEEQDLEKTEHLQLDDIKYMMTHHENLVVEHNKLVAHMKEALKSLSSVLKKELMAIELIKKNPMNKDQLFELSNLIASNEIFFAKIFGEGLKGEQYKKIENIVHAALTDSQIKNKNKPDEREVMFKDEYRLKERKNRLNKISAYFTQMLSELGEDDFEIFYTQTSTGSMLSSKTEYGIFIRPKNSKLRGYSIMIQFGEDLDRRLKNEQILQECRGFKDRLKQGIRILKAVAS